MLHCGQSNLGCERTKLTTSWRSSYFWLIAHGCNIGKTYTCGKPMIILRSVDPTSGFPLRRRHAGFVQQVDKIVSHMIYPYQIEYVCIDNSQLHGLYCNYVKYM